jgi:hypothetical protein
VTPVQIEVILKFWYLAHPDRERWSPTQKEFIGSLIRSGHLVDTVCGAVIANREALEPIVDALCAVPLSRRDWSLPAPERAPEPASNRRKGPSQETLPLGQETGCSYPQEVKEIAYKLDPECWVSYSGQTRHYKRVMEIRRQASLARAMEQHWKGKHS